MRSTTTKLSPKTKNRQPYKKAVKKNDESSQRSLSNGSKCVVRSNVSKRRSQRPQNRPSTSASDSLTEKGWQGIAPVSWQPPDGKPYIRLDPSELDRSNIPVKNLNGHGPSSRQLHQGYFTNGLASTEDKGVTNGSFLDHREFVRNPLRLDPRSHLNYGRLGSPYAMPPRQHDEHQSKAPLHQKRYCPFHEIWPSHLGLRDEADHLTRLFSVAERPEDFEMDPYRFNELPILYNTPHTNSDSVSNSAYPYFHDQHTDIDPETRKDEGKSKRKTTPEEELEMAPMSLADIFFEDAYADAKEMC
ncbi:hypothetical protein BDQ12DRAFT_734055 [Crucibulum laeve]|uniref:Uncharacterized protein n=1 Tax=Crucibulum laeve TaxID=68775 RepID=A0A5C3M601_9AGAR|nr:hypothetical protein BDQ12DRAFT_734055 [Crucibulum laeve]